MTHRYRIVYLGMQGEYSLIPFQALLKAEAEMAGVVIPHPNPNQKQPHWPPPTLVDEPLLPLIATTSTNLHSEAGRNQIPVLSVGDLNSPETLSAFESLKPDLVITACFSRILPEKWLQVPKHGCLNLHPSLLPAYRGTNPLFWQFYHGETETGVTLHFMDAGVDSGDIAAQKKIEFPEGITAMEADRIVAMEGAELILEAISQKPIPRRPQSSENSSYHPQPTEKDKSIHHTMDVKHAYRFLRGADEWSPFWIEKEDGSRMEVSEALDYRLGDAPEGEGWVKMSGGVLKIR